MKNFIIDLTEGLNDPTKAKAVVKRVQNVIDELVEANQEALQVAKDANANADEYEKQCNNLNKSNQGLVEALKNVHIVLGSKIDLFKDDEGMNELMKELGKFIMSSGAIKSGVVKNATV